MEPRVEVDDCLVVLVQGQECCKPLYLLFGDSRCIQRLDSSAEFILHDLLGKAVIIHRHVHALHLALLRLPALLLQLCPLFLGPLRHLFPRLLGILLRLLCKDVAQVEPLVHERCLDVG